MTNNCAKCGSDVQDGARSCLVCQADVGFPNVRMASQKIEEDALKERYECAEASARAGNYLTEFQLFENSASKSDVVMNRTLGALFGWMNSQSPLFLNFHDQVKYLGRMPTESHYDQQRVAAESTINPFCYDKLSYCALTLDNLGMTYYGDYSVILKQVTIEDRASVFDCNVFTFNEKHHVIAGRSPPAGYRSTWSDRGRLAIAKLHTKLTPGMSANNFGTIMIEDRRDKPDCDYVEVHIFGPVNIAGIERIVGNMPSKKADKLLWRQIVRKARDLNVNLEERP